MKRSNTQAKRDIYEIQRRNTHCHDGARFFLRHVCYLCSSTKGRCRAAKARATVTEAPETAAEAEAIRSSQEEDAGFPIYTQDSNYDYDDSSDDSDNSDTGTDTSDTTTSDTTTSDTTTSDTDNSYVDSSTDNNYDDGSSDNVVDEGISQPGDYDYPDGTDDSGDGFTYYEPDNTGTDDTTSSDNGDYVEE